MSGISAIRAGRRLLGLSLLLLGLLVLGQGTFTYGKAALAQALLQQSWQKTLAGQTKARPWPWADTWPVARIEAPRLSKSNIVLQEAGGETLAFGPTLLNIGDGLNQKGQILIAAHKNTHFNWLKDLKSGDTLQVQTPDGKRIEYQVTGMEVVRYDVSGISVESHQNRLALITCYPFDAGYGGPLRYVVWAEPISDAKPVIPNEVIS